MEPSCGCGAGVGRHIARQSFAGHRGRRGNARRVSNGSWLRLRTILMSPSANLRVSRASVWSGPTLWPMVTVGRRQPRSKTLDKGCSEPALRWQFQRAAGQDGPGLFATAHLLEEAPMRNDLGKGGVPVFGRRKGVPIREPKYCFSVGGFLACCFFSFVLGGAKCQIPNWEFRRQAVGQRGVWPTGIVVPKSKSSPLRTTGLLGS